MKEPTFWDVWGPWIGGGGFIAFLTLVLSYIARPSKETIADLRHDVEALEVRRAKDIEDMKRDHNAAIAEMRMEHAQEMTVLRGEVSEARGEVSEARKEIGGLRESNFHMKVVFTALSVQYNIVRQELLKRDPTSDVLTIRQIVDESHVPLQNVMMFDPASVGFLWPDRSPPPSNVIPRSIPPPV